MTSLSERTWYRVLACMLAMLASAGLIGNVFAPLLPAMLDSHWLNGSQAGYINGMTSLGWILGSIACIPLARRLTGGWVCRGALVCGLLSLLLASIDFGPAWLAGCRLLAGLSAAGASVLAPVLVIQGIDPSIRSRVLGLTFAGAGLGTILISVTLPLPALSLTTGPVIGWLYTAGLTAICIVIAWPGLRTRGIPSQIRPAKLGPTPHRKRMLLLTASYFFFGSAIAPMFIYLSAYIYIAFNQSVTFSAMIFAVYGLGNMIGSPLFDGLISRWIGHYLSILLAMLVGLAGMLLIIMTTSLWLAIASGLLVGVSNSAATSLLADRAMRIVGPTLRIRWWGIMTLFTCVSEVIGSVLMGILLVVGWGYSSVFWVGAISFLFAILFASCTKVPRSSDSLAVSPATAGN